MHAKANREISQKPMQSRCKASKSTEWASTEFLKNFLEILQFAGSAEQQMLLKFLKKIVDNLIWSLSGFFNFQIPMKTNEDTRKTSAFWKRALTR